MIKSIYIFLRNLESKNIERVGSTSNLDGAIGEVHDNGLGCPYPAPNLGDGVGEGAGHRFPGPLPALRQVLVHVLREVPGKENR